MAGQNLEKGSFAAVLPWVGFKPVKGARSGEGSRGGHIIGPTSSGKAIYAAGHRSLTRLSSEDRHEAADLHEVEASKLRQKIGKFKDRAGLPVSAFDESAHNHHDPEVRKLVEQHSKEMVAAHSYRSGARAMTREGALLQSQDAAERTMGGMDDLVADYLEKAEAMGNSPFGKRSEEDPPEEGMAKPGESLKPPLPEQNAKPGQPLMAGKPVMPAAPGVSPVGPRPPAPGAAAPTPGAPPMGGRPLMPGQTPGVPPKPGAEGAPSGESLVGKLPAPSIHEDQANLEAALSKVSHLGEKGFRSLHPDTQQELIADGYLDPQGNITAAGHKELINYFAKHAANPNLGPQAQQKAQMRHQAHTEAAGQEASGHPAVHATWQQKQIEMRSGGMAQPGQPPGGPPQASGVTPGKPPMGQGAPQMGGQGQRPMPPQGSIPGQPGPLGMAPRPPAAGTGAPMPAMGARPPVPPMGGGAPAPHLPAQVTQAGGAMPPAQAALPVQSMQAKPGVIPAKPVKPAKPMPPQFQKAMSGLDDLGDYLEKAMGGERSGHKYIRRTGAPGSYEYVYAHPKTGEYKVDAATHFKRERSAARKEGFGQQSLPMGGQAPLAPDRAIASAPDYLDRIGQATASAKKWESEAPQRQVHESKQKEADAHWSTLTSEQKQKYRSDPKAMEHPHGAAGMALDAAAAPASTSTRDAPPPYHDAAKNFLNTGLSYGVAAAAGLQASSNPHRVAIGKELGSLIVKYKELGKKHGDTPALTAALDAEKAKTHSAIVGILQRAGSPEAADSADQKKQEENKWKEDQDSEADATYKLQHPEASKGEQSVRHAQEEAGNAERAAHGSEEKAKAHFAAANHYDDAYEAHKNSDKKYAQSMLQAARQHREMGENARAVHRTRQEAGRAGEPSAAEKSKALAKDKADLAKYKEHLKILQHGGRISEEPHLTAASAIHDIQSLTEVIANKEKAGWGRTSQAEHPDVAKYVKAIKNPAKKEYAQAYAKWKQGGEQGKEPEHGSLSYMGAQAVRLHLGNILAPRQKTEGISGFQTPVPADKPASKANWNPEAEAAFARRRAEQGGQPIAPEKSEDVAKRLGLRGLEPRYTYEKKAGYHALNSPNQKQIEDLPKGSKVTVLTGPNKGMDFFRMGNQWHAGSDRHSHTDMAANVFGNQVAVTHPDQLSKPAKLKTVKVHQGNTGNPAVEVPVRHSVGNMAVHANPNGPRYHVTHVPSGKFIASYPKLSDAKAVANAIHAAVPNAMNDLGFGEYPKKGHDPQVKKMSDALKAFNEGKDVAKAPIKKSEGLSELGDYLRKSEALVGGRADGKSSWGFDAKSVAQGMRVEAEHSSNPKVQREIAQDHLTEDPEYYKKLARMEKSDRAGKAITQLLQRNPHPEDSVVHALAGKLGMKVDDLEERIYAMAGKAQRTEKCMSKSGLNELGDYLKKSDGMPDQSGWDDMDKPVEQTLGGSPNGGDLTETPSPEGANDGAGEGQDARGQITGAPPGQPDIFGDDRPVEQQMTPGESALEAAIPEGYKSMTPANQRSMVAHEHAQKVMQLQKSNDVRVGGSVHPYSMQGTHDGTDAEAANLCKSEFYTGGHEPTLAPPGAIIRQTVLCKSEGCGCKYPALLTSCPSCGDGMVKSRMLPKGAYMGGDGNEAVRLEKAVFDPIIKPAPVEADVHIPGPSPVVTRRRG